MTSSTSPQGAQRPRLLPAYGLQEPGTLRALRAVKLRFTINYI
jgi:hypothetical protein